MPLHHHSLVVWQRADDLFIDIHKLTRTSLPDFERYELGSQLRRAAYSVAANIVEGSEREHRKERLNFLSVSRASLAEVGYCLHVFKRLDYIDDIVFRTLDVAVRQVSAALHGYIRAVKEGRAR
jgi:four helix bundle protein